MNNNGTIDNSVRVRVLRTESELEEIRDIWMQWQQHPNSNRNFYLTIVGARPETIRPHVIVVYRGPRPDALLIGRVEQNDVHFKLGYMTICRVRTRSLVFIYKGLLGNDCSDNAQTLLLEISKALQEHEGDVALLSSFGTESPMYTCAKQVIGLRSWSYFDDPQSHWSITLPTSFDEFLHRLPTKVRRNRKQEANKLLRDFSGSVTITCFSKCSEIETMIDDVESIAKKTYHRGLGVGFVANEENRRRFVTAAKQGQLRGYVLYVASRPCAFMIGTLYAGTFYGDFMGYDPAHQRYSPGTFLLLRIINDLCSIGAKRVDFGFGDAWYKEHFCDCEWKESSIHMYAPTAKGILLMVLQNCTSFINRTGTNILRRSNLILHAKRTWRRLNTGGGATAAYRGRAS